MTWDVGTIVQWAGAIGILGFIGTLVTIRSQKRKISADAAAVITQSAISLLAPMKAELAEMKTELESARRDLGKLHAFTKEILQELSQYRQLNSGEIRILQGESGQAPTY